MGVFWQVAAIILYALPVLAGLRRFDDIVEEAKEFMRETGDWYPILAQPIAITAIVFWPVLAAFIIITPDED